MKAVLRMNVSKIKIFVATHKSYDFPKLNMYIPIQVGCALREDDFGYVRDNTAEDSISHKNVSFCELTALYEVYKSEEYKELEYVGMVHYRRYFFGKSFKFHGKGVLGEDEVLTLLQDFDVIMPKKRNYYIESVYNHYKNAHYENDLLEIEKIVVEKCPEYSQSFKNVLKGKRLHLFNMFIMKKELFDAYMKWLFDLLFELERRIDISDYDTYQKRVFGFISERLFNVWLTHNSLKLLEVKVVNIECENLPKKALSLLKRKFIKK